MKRKLLIWGVQLALCVLIAISYNTRHFGYLVSGIVCLMCSAYFEGYKDCEELWAPKERKIK